MILINKILKLIKYYKMKKILIATLISLSLYSCKKEKIQPIETKQKLFLKVEAIDKDGNVISSTDVITVN